MYLTLIRTLCTNWLCDERFLGTSLHEDTFPTFGCRRSDCLSSQGSPDLYDWDKCSCCTEIFWNFKRWCDEHRTLPCTGISWWQVAFAFQASTCRACDLCVWSKGSASRDLFGAKSSAKLHIEMDKSVLTRTKLRLSNQCRCAGKTLDLSGGIMRIVRSI